MADTKSKYLITDSPLKALFIFFIPIMLGNIFQQFYNLCDSAILGQFVSEQALAAAGACLSFTNVFLFIANGAGIGAAVIVGRHFGAADYKKMKTVMTTAYIAFFSVSVVLGLFGFFAGHRIMVLLNTPDDTIGLASTYLRIYFLGLPFIFIYNVTSAMYNALGKSKYPLFFLIFSSLLNIALDLLFVTEFHSGIAGVAFATLISQGISCVLSVSVFASNIRKFRIEKTELFNTGDLAKITGIALPSIFQQTTISIGLMLIQSTVNSFGSQALAGFSVGLRIESLGSTIMVAGGTAFSTFVAQNLGAGKLGRIKKGYFAANIIQCTFAFLFFISIYIFKTRIIWLFIGQDCSPTAYSTALGYLTYMSHVLVIMGFKHTADGVLRGLGRMKMFMAGNVVNICIRVSFSKIVSRIIGISAVWISNPIGWIASLSMCYLSYRKIRREMNF